jgi:hypothetical protein
MVPIKNAVSRLAGSIIGIPTLFLARLIDGQMLFNQTSVIALHRKYQYLRFSKRDQNLIYGDFKSE